MWAGAFIYVKRVNLLPDVHFSLLLKLATGSGPFCGRNENDSSLATQRQMEMACHAVFAAQQSGSKVPQGKQANPENPRSCRETR
jgi:hypothetical protein